MMDTILQIPGIFYRTMLWISDFFGILASTAFWTGFWNDTDKIEGQIVTVLTILSLSLTIVYKWKNRKK